MLEDDIYPMSDDEQNLTEPANSLLFCFVLCVSAPLRLCVFCVFALGVAG